MKRIYQYTLIVFVVLFLYSCFQKPDEGTWELLGFEDKIAYRIVLSDSCLYACAGEDGLWKMNINESSSEWLYLGMADSSLADYPNRGVKDVVVNPENLDELLIVFDAVDSEAPSIYRSLNNGENWSIADSGLKADYMDSEYNRKIRVLCSSYDYILGGGAGIFKTQNFGLSWEDVSAPSEVGGQYCTMVCHKEVSDVIWFSGTDLNIYGTLASSFDGGNTWRIYDNYGYSEMDIGYASTIAIHPIDTNTVYVGVNDKLIKTTNGGDSWIELNNSNMYLTSIIVDPENGDHLWSCGGQIFRESFDGGITWQEIETPIQANIKDMIFDENIRSLYFGTVDGIYGYILTNN